MVSSEESVYIALDIIGDDDPSSTLLPFLSNGIFSGNRMNLLFSTLSKKKKTRSRKLFSCSKRYDSKCRRDLASSISYGSSVD